MQHYRKQKPKKKKKKHGLQYKPSVVVKPVLANFPVQMEEVTEDLSIDTRECLPLFPCSHFVSFKGRSEIWGAHRISQYFTDHGLEVPKHFSQNVKWHFPDQ